MRTLSRRTTAPVDCPRCGVTYRPSLTGGTCPVCDTTPGGEHGAGTPERDLLVPIVLVATVVNVLLLGLLAIAVARVG